MMRTTFTPMRRRARLHAGAVGLLLVMLLALLATSGTAHAADRSGLGCSTEAPAGVDPGPAWTQQVVDLVNDHRQSLGLARLAAEPTLERVATWKARDMVARGVSDNGHDDPGLGSRPARTFEQRALTCGFGNAPVGENLAMGTAAAATPRMVVDGWLGSPTHRSNIERPGWRFMGIGSATGAADAHGQRTVSFAQVFSEQRNVSIPRCSTTTVIARVGSAVALRSKLCRTDGTPTLVGAAPRWGTLKGLRYVPARRLGRNTFTLRWPDTGVRQVVEVVVRRARPSAKLTKLRCTAARRCSTRVTLVRPATAARAQLVVQRRVGSRWRTVRKVNLRRARGTIRPLVRTTLPKGRVRVRVEIARASMQDAGRSAWQTRFVR